MTEENTQAAPPPNGQEPEPAMAKSETAEPEPPPKNGDSKKDESGPPPPEKKSGCCERLWSGLWALPHQVAGLPYDRAHTFLAWTTRALLALLTTGLLLAMTASYVLWICGNRHYAIRLTAPLTWLVTHPPGWPLVVGGALAIGAVLFFQQIASFLHRLQEFGGAKAAPPQVADRGQVKTAGQILLPPSGD